MDQPAAQLGKLSSQFAQWCIALLALLIPTVVTLVYFVWLKGHSAAIQQTAYSIGKIAQFALPAICVLLIERRKIRLMKPQAADVLLGLGSGVLIVAVAVVLYVTWLLPSGLMSGVAEQARQRVEGIGLKSSAAFVGLAVFYGLGHSLLEEYYWRWFTYAHLRSLLPIAAANIISSLGFMAHHVIVLAAYFGWLSPLTWLLSISVAIGGSIWAAMYERRGNLYGPWLSHMLVDAGIFGIGWHLLM